MRRASCSGIGETVERRREIVVRLAKAGHRAGQWREAPERGPMDPTPPARPRRGELEADDTATRSDDATHLPEAGAEIGQVAKAEGDRGGVELAIPERQGKGVADNEFELYEIAGCSPTAVDHPGR